MADATCRVALGCDGAGCCEAAAFSWSEDWSGRPFAYAGEHYRFEGCPALPRTVQGRPQLIMGGKGRRRTPALAARYADEFNGVFTSVEETGQIFDRVRAACRDAGRNPSSMTWSVAVTIRSRPR